MTLSNPKPLGYSFGELLPSAHVNSVWSQLPNAVDGIGGGSYTLIAPLSIDGDTVTLETLDVTTTLDVGGNATLGTVSTDLHTVNGMLTCNGHVILGDTSGDSLNVNATATFNAGTTFNGNVTLGNAGTDAVGLAAVMSPSGTGRARDSGSALPNADTAVDVATSRYLYAAPATTAKTYTLSCTNEGDGDWFRFVNGGSVTAVIAGLVSIPAFATGTGRMYMRIAGAWTLVDIWST